jgi:uncharacterized protein (DUF1330 family)
MPAYVLVEMDVTDQEAIADYRRLSTIAAEVNGARYLARGGATELLEGSGEPARIVLLEFDDLTAAKAWYRSPEYQAAKAAREGIATARFIAVEGLG